MIWYVLAVVKKCRCSPLSQEDEEEVKKRKMKAEEVDVDIDSVPEEPCILPLAVDDEDIKWADQEPDDDAEPWKMKVLIQRDHRHERVL